MKILVIAYEYPPIISVQSIHWFYLASEMAFLGVKSVWSEYRTLKFVLSWTALRKQQLLRLKQF
jgi:hypothetical protein